MDMNTTASVEQSIVQTLQEFIPNLRAVILYGSRVDPTNPSIRQDSDWDVAVLAEPTDPTTGELFAKAQWKLWALDDQINLVQPFRCENDELLFQIVKHHRVLWSETEGWVFDFITRALRSVQEFELRRSIYQPNTKDHG